MNRRPPRSTLDRSSAASDVYKRQAKHDTAIIRFEGDLPGTLKSRYQLRVAIDSVPGAVSYTHLRAHETVLALVCRLLLEKKKTNATPTTVLQTHHT